MLPTSSSYDIYGGEKADYAPPEDASTDRSADHMNEALADVAAMTRMCPRAWLTFDASGQVNGHEAMWGNGDAVKPTCTVEGTGQFRFTWPAVVTDARGVQHAVNFRWAHVISGIPDVIFGAFTTGPNQIMVSSVSGATGDPADPSDIVNVTVW